MVNPFDLGTYDFPTVNIDSTSTDFAMDKAVSTQVPYLDIELPSTDVTIPTPRTANNPLNSYLPQTNTQDPKKKEADYNDSLYNELVNTKFKSDRVAYTYNAAMDVKYKDLNYNPNKDMEKIYDDKQSTWDVFKKQNSRLWNNLSNSVRDQYVGQGRLIYNLGKGQFDNDAFLNKPETLATYLQSLNEDFYNPIYGQESANWYSMKGWLGDTYSSSGFAAGAMVTGLIDATVGSGIKKLVFNPIGAAVLGLGTVSLFSDTVRDKIGEENANIVLGMLGGGVMSNAISGGVSAFTKSIPQASIPVLREAVKGFKKSEDFTKILYNTVDNTLKNITGGTILDATSQLAKNIKIANTIDKSLTAGLTAAKMYLSSGAESGMEAIQAQYDYIGEKMKEAQKNGKVLSDEEYQQAYNESIDMSKNVYNMNRLLLGATNSIEFGDIIKGTFVKNGLKDYGIKYLEGKTLDESFQIIGSPLKSWYKNRIINSLSEGFEEGAQYTISEGNKDYLRNREKHKSALDSFMYGAQETLTTTQGWGNIMSGIMTGVGMSEASGHIKGITQAANGGNYLGGYTGFDKKQSEAIVDQLKGRFQNLYDVTTNHAEFNKIYDGINNLTREDLKKVIKTSDNYLDGLENQQQRILDNLFHAAISGIETGNSKMTRKFIEDYFDVENKQNTTNVNGVSETNFDKLIKAFGKGENKEEDKQTILKVKNDILENFDKAESTVKVFQEYYNNPYTISNIDKAFENKFINNVTSKFGIKKDTINDKKAKAEIFDSLVRGAARTLFMRDSMLKESVENRANLKNFLNDDKLINETGFDIRPYLSGERNSYTNLMSDLNTQIDTYKKLNINVDNVLGTNDNQLSKEDAKQLEKLEKLKEQLYDSEYEKILNGEQSEEKEVLENRASPVLKLAMKVWNDHVKDDTSKINDTKTFKYLLKSVDNLENSIFFFSKDLKGFTSEEDQKKLVDFLFETKVNMLAQQSKIKEILQAKQVEKDKAEALKKEEDLKNGVLPNDSTVSPASTSVNTSTPSDIPNVSTTTSTSSVLNISKNKFDLISIIQDLKDKGVSDEDIRKISEFIPKLQSLYDKNLEDIFRFSDPLKFKVPINKNLQSYDPSIDNVIEGDTRKEVEDKLFETYKYLLEKISKDITNSTNNQSKSLSNLGEVESFTTERGSIYTINKNLSVTREKTAQKDPNYVGDDKNSNTVKESSDVIFFINPNNTTLFNWFSDNQATNSDGKGTVASITNTFLLVKLPDGTFKKVRNNTEVNNNLEIVVLRFNKFTNLIQDKEIYTQKELEDFSKETVKPENKGVGVVVADNNFLSVIPKIGYSTFDYRFDNNGNVVSKHIGNKVTDIKLKVNQSNSNVSENIENKTAQTTPDDKQAQIDEINKRRNEELNNASTLSPSEIEKRKVNRRIDLQNIIEISKYGDTVSSALDNLVKESQRLHDLATKEDVALAKNQKKAQISKLESESNPNRVKAKNVDILINIVNEYLIGRVEDITEGERISSLNKKMTDLVKEYKDDVDKVNTKKRLNVDESKAINAKYDAEIAALNNQDNTTNISAEDSLRIRTSENNKKKLVEDLLFPSKEKETNLKKSITKQVNLDYYEVDFSRDSEGNKEIIEFLNEHAKSKKFKIENNNNVITIWSTKGRPEHLDKKQVIKTSTTPQVESTLVDKEETIIPPLITFLNNYVIETVIPKQNTQENVQEEKPVTEKVQLNLIPTDFASDKDEELELMLLDPLISNLNYDSIKGIYKIENDGNYFILVEKEGKEILYTEILNSDDMLEVGISSITNQELSDYTEAYTKAKNKTGDSELGLDLTQMNKELENSDISLEYSNC